MADEEDVNFDDRWNLDEPPETTPEEEADIAKKKEELLKLAQKVDIPEPKIEAPPAERSMPPPPMPPQIQPQTFFDKLMGVTAPKFLPGAPSAAPIPPPPAPEARTAEEIPPEVAQELAKLLNDKYSPKDEGPRDIGRAPMREAELKPGEGSPAKDVVTKARTDLLAKMREPMRQEIENNPRLKLRVAALLALENPGAGPAVVESMLNRAAYTGRSIDSITSLGDRSFYGPGRIPGKVEAKMAELARDPKQRDHLFGLINEAYSSNVTKGHTDQGSKGDPNYYAGGVGVNINRERFNDWGGGPGGIAGARRFREELQRAAGKPYVSMAEVGPFLTQQPMAQQKAELTGGLPDTPIAAAQTAELMKGTPLEKIKNISDVMRKAAYRGAASGQGGQVPREVTPTRGEVQPQAPLPQPYMPQQNFLPMPSVTHTPSMIDQATNPSLMSTIMAEMAQRGTPITPPPKAGEQPVEQPKSFLDRLTLPNPVEVFKTMLRNNDVSGAEAVQNVKDFIAGAAQQPVNAFNATVTPLAAGAGLLSGNEALKEFADLSTIRGEEYKKGVREFFGTKPGGSAESAGAALQPSMAGTALNMLIGKGAEMAAPYLSQFAQKYPIPSLVSPAQAASVFGQPPRVYNTPGGPVVMNDATLSEMVYGGVAMLGIGLTPAALARGHRVATEWNSYRTIYDPVREVQGAPGTKAASTVGDIFKAATVDNVQAMFDATNRLARMEKPPATFMEIMRGRDVGIDPIAAASVKQRWRIQTGSGGQNLINNAINDGKMNTPAFKFDVDVSIGKLHEATQQLPDFAHYLKAKMIQEQLNVNHALRTQLPSGAPRGQLQQLQNPPPRSYKDANGQQWTKAYADGAVATLEGRPYGPQLKDLYQRYQENLAETRRFISDGQYNVENPISLDSKASEMPTFPIFSERRNTGKVLGRILNDDNPLSVVEDNMRFALNKAMVADSQRAFIEMAPKSAFTRRNQQWIDSRGQVPKENGSVLTIRQDGEAMHWTADPFIASVMRSNDAPMASWGSFFSTPKAIFTSTTTGKGMPPFSIIAAMRAMQQGWVTAPGNIRVTGKIMPEHNALPAGPIAMAMALPRILVPQYLHDLISGHGFVGRSFQNGVLKDMIPPATHATLIQTMEKAYANSWYAKMKEGGAFTGDTIMQSEPLHARISRQKLQYANTPHEPIVDFMHRASDAALQWIKTNPYGRHVERTRQAINDAAPFAFSYKMRKGATEVDPITGGSRVLHTSEIANLYRDYTGDPAIRGTPHGLKFEMKTPGGERAANAALGFGKMIEPLKPLVPWAGVLVQSPAKTLAAMRDNPIRANMAYTMGNVLPEMVAYLWNMQQGQEFLDYQFNGRGEYATTNKIYIAPYVSDRNNPPKPNQGIEMDWYQEGAPARAIARAFMRQYFGLNSTNMYEDVNAALKGFLGTTFMPPVHPLANVGSVMVSGQPMPMQGLFGELFVSKPNPFDPASRESTLEKSVRQIAPGVADVFLAGKHAFAAGPDLWSKGTGAYQAAKHRVEQRTPIVRDFIGAKPPVSGSPVVNEKLFKYDRMIKDLVRRYRTIEVGKGDIPLKSPGVSAGGMARVAPGLPQPPPAERAGKIPNPGISIAEPENPLYKMWMGEMEKTFIKDDPAKGSIGYRSMWKHYSIYSQALKRLATVNEGNSAQWVREQQDKPKTVEYLKRNGVDPYDFRAVRDYYNYNRGLVGQSILRTMEATEQRINRDKRVRDLLGGKEFKIEMLDPKDNTFEGDKPDG